MRILLGASDAAASEKCVGVHIKRHGRRIARCAVRFKGTYAGHLNITLFLNHP